MNNVKKYVEGRDLNFYNANNYIKGKLINFKLIKTFRKICIVEGDIFTIYKPYFDECKKFMGYGSEIRRFDHLLGEKEITNVMHKLSYGDVDMIFNSTVYRKFNMEVFMDLARIVIVTLDEEGDIARMIYNSINDEERFFIDSLILLIAGKLAGKNRKELVEMVEDKLVYVENRDRVICLVNSWKDKKSTRKLYSKFLRTIW